jgi:uncharacterized protein
MQSHLKKSGYIMQVSIFPTKFLLGVLFAVVQCTAQAQVSDIERARKWGIEAFNAYENRQEKRAAQLYLRAAKAGNPNAQYNIAIMRINQETTIVSEKQALQFLRLSAQSNFADAQWTLGKLLEKNDAAASAMWHEKAAQQGLPQAQVALANLYFLGRGVPQSDQISARWYQRAAEGGEVHAQATMGAFYERGIGVERDWQQAVTWYALAARQGDQVAGLQAKYLVERLAKGDAPL